MVSKLKYNKKILKGLTLEQLEQCMQEIGEKPFRAKQLFQWMYQKGVRSFDEMSSLSQNFREKLSKGYILTTIKEKKIVKSGLDKTIKYLFELNDGNLIESVYMIEGKRATVCLSTQVGCPIGCSHCATGLMKFKRNLTTGEIVDQLLWINSNSKMPITNVVFMGMGEPFLNYENTINAANILNSECGQEISARKITISTCGITTAIYRYAEEKHKFKLAISLNGTTDDQRNQLVPINKKYPIKELLEASLFYTRKSRKKVTFEYILIADFNDSLSDARRLVKLLSPVPCKLNIIPFNENRHVTYKCPSEETLEKFIKEVYRAPFIVTVRRSKGVDIAAACGQLYTDEIHL